MDGFAGPELNEVRFVLVDLEIRVITNGAELVTSDEVEANGSEFSEEGTDPSPRVREGGIKKENDDASEIDIANDNEVEATEEDKFFERDASLAVGLRRNFERIHGGYDGEEDSSAADDIDSAENVKPNEPIVGSRHSLFSDDESNISKDLSRQDDEKEAFVAVGEVGFQKSETSTDHENDGKESNSTSGLEDIIGDVPTLGIASASHGAIHESLAK